MPESIKRFYDSLIEIEDIRALIKGEERESVTLDYKQADRKWNHTAKEKIAKHLSAFANSEGGILIFGVACDEKDKDCPVEITGLHPENRAEDFDRVASSAIRPEVKNLARKIISDETNEVLVIYIPSSPDSPHQSVKHKQYFHRAGAQSMAMEHYLVQRYFGRNYYPNLEIVIKEPNRLRATCPKKGWTNYYLFQFFVRNQGKGTAKGCSGQIVFPSPHLAISKYASTYFKTDVEQISGWMDDSINTHHFIINRDIHPGSSYCFYEIAFAFEENFLNSLLDKAFLNYEIFAQEMPPKQNSIKISKVIQLASLK